MSVEEIEKAIPSLTAKDRARLLALLERLGEAEFDAKIARDAKAGKLDKLGKMALADVKAGRFRKL